MDYILFIAIPRVSQLVTIHCETYSEAWAAYSHWRSSRNYSKARIWSEVSQRFI